ncbi:MAG TPA: HDOD domain-containing protein [Verrucomicrobiae bacterium]|jgi:HD-like signal output (HDOD) protein|nr:HDOD domain-containing protein [Verrucomicrobiae bacterium]
MTDKRILFADADVEELYEFRRQFGPTWEVLAVGTGPAALEEIRKNPCDVLIADMNLPEMSGAELLNHVRGEFPKTVCFILAPDADRERVMQTVLCAHQFLAKPCEPAALKAHVDRAMALDTWIASNSMRELVARVRTFPTVPSLYIEIISALKSPDATTEQIGKIIAKDMAMMTKLLQVINSACFGLPRKISDPVEAVGLMGFEAVKSMVMTIKLLSQYDKIKPVYFSIDRLWRHSTDVARTAKQLTLLHTENAQLAETAFTAGLMHDIGKVVLAANFDEQYRGAQSLAKRQKLPAWEVEHEIFGASHGEIGAYLLGLWGMPLDLLEVAAMHHQPSRSINKEFTTLTAVHIANVLEHELTPDPDEPELTAKFDDAYLEKVGLLDVIPQWREMVFKRDFTKPAKNRTEKAPAPKAARTGESDTARLRRVSPLPATAGKTADAGSKSSAPNVAWLLQKKRWVYAAVAAGIVIPSLVWLLSGSSSTAPETAAAPAPAPASAPTTAAATKPAQSTPAASTASSAPTTTGSVLNPTLVVRARTAATTTTTTTVAPLTVKGPAAPVAFADLKLQGIFYSSRDASAIVSGVMVHENERVFGAEVIQITPANVVLEYKGQRRTLILK